MLRAEYILIICILVVGGSSMVTDHDQPNSLHVAHSNDRTMTDKHFQDILSILVEKVNTLETIIYHGVSSTKAKTEDLYSKLYYMSKQIDTLQTKHDSMELELHMAKQEIMSIKMLMNSSSKIGENRINKLEQQLAMTISNVQNLIKEHTVSTRDLRAIYNKTMEAEQGIASIQAKLTKTSGEITAKNKHVAMTACTLGGDFTNTSFIDFTEIKSVYGLNKTQIATFKKNRKFTCQKPGLYFITAHIMSSSIFSTYRIVKNDVIEMGRIQIAPNRDGGTQNWHTGSGGAVVWLKTKDTLGLQVWGNKMYIGSFSCMTIIKQ